MIIFFSLNQRCLNPLRLRLKRSLILWPWACSNHTYSLCALMRAKFIRVGCTGISSVCVLLCSVSDWCPIWNSSERQPGTCKWCKQWLAETWVAAFPSPCFYACFGGSCQIGVMEVPKIGKEMFYFAKKVFTLVWDVFFDVRKNE